MKKPITRVTPLSEVEGPKTRGVRIRDDSRRDDIGIQSKDDPVAVHLELYSYCAGVFDAIGKVQLLGKYLPEKCSIIAYDAVVDVPNIPRRVAVLLTRHWRGSYDSVKKVWTVPDFQQLDTCNRMAPYLQDVRKREICCRIVQLRTMLQLDPEMESPIVREQLRALHAAELPT